MNKKQNSLFDPDFISGIIRDIWNKKHTELLEMQNLKKQKLLQMRIWDMMGQMQIDLYQAFQNHTYANLAPIQTPLTIRIFTFKKENDTFLYKFTLAKSSDIKLPFVSLQGIHLNMNTDIASVQRQLLYAYGYEYLVYHYPYLAQGIYVTNVEELGLSDIIITVVTHIQP